MLLAFVVCLGAGALVTEPAPGTDAPGLATSASAGWVWGGTGGATLGALAGASPVKPSVSGQTHKQIVIIYKFIHKHL